MAIRKYAYDFDMDAAPACFPLNGKVGRDWAPVAERIRKNPGVWVKIAEYEKGGGLASQVRLGNVASMIGFDATYRHVGYGVHEIFVRCPVEENGESK